MSVDVQLDERVAEVHGQFTGRVLRTPDADGLSTQSRARKVLLALRLWTEGRGTVDRLDVSTMEFDIGAHGGIDATFLLRVPATSPVSYDGSIVRVAYKIEARLDLKMAIDQKYSQPVLVVPKGGMGTYERPHPLPMRIR